MLFARPCPSSSRIDDGFDEHTHAPLEEIETLDTELGLALEMAFLVIEVGRGDELLAAELRAYFLSLPAQHAAQLTLAAPPPPCSGTGPADPHLPHADHRLTERYAQGASAADLSTEEGAPANILLAPQSSC